MPKLKETQSCPQCQICGKRYHRLLSHVKLSHGMTKEEYLSKYPHSKIHSDEYISKHKITSDKIKKSQIKFWTSPESNETRQHLSEIQREIQAQIPKEVKEERAKLRNQQIKNDINRYNRFREKCRIASRKYWDNIDEDTKKINIARWNNGWKNWYNNLDEEERLAKQHRCRVRRMIKVNINGIDYTFKSQLEFIIANFLAKNNIIFEYESIVIDISKYNNINSRKKYYPDFYIPKYNLILESKGLYRKSKNETNEDVLNFLNVQLIATLNDKRYFSYEYIWYNRKSDKIIEQLITILNSYGEDIVHKNI